MEPTALQAFRTTSRLLGSECAPDYEEQESKMLKETHRQITATVSTIRSSYAGKKSTRLMFVASSNNIRRSQKRSGIFGFQILKFPKTHFNLFRSDCSMFQPLLHNESLSNKMINCKTTSVKYTLQSNDCWDLSSPPFSSRQVTF